MYSAVRCIWSIIVFSAFFFDGTTQEEVKYEITVDHPGFGEEDRREYDLWSMVSDNHQIDGYYLDVESVICVDHRCKIVPVRIYWDALGNYEKYELADGMIMEKTGGEPFLDEDYARLHEVLLDKSSPYKDLSYYHITHEKVVGEGEVDAVTGATAIVLDESRTVRGGAWTCYTLWHWANGNVIPKIQRITGSASSSDELLEHMASNDHQRQSFALHELTNRGDYSPKVVDNVIQEMSNAESDPHFLRGVLSYLNQGPSSTFYDSLEKLLLSSPKNRRMLMWKSVSKYTETPPPAYFDKFFEKIIQSENYQEINLFLSLLEEKKGLSRGLVQEMVPLLEEEYSIINRRIYWFLSAQKLSKAQARTLEEYYARNEEYLQ